MSIILNALRKAEASRRGVDRVDLTAAPVRHVPLHSRIPLGFVAATATLFLSVGVGAWLLWPDEPVGDVPVASRAPAPQPGSGVAAAESATVARSTGESPVGSAPSTPPVAVADAPPAAATAPAPAGPEAQADVRMLALEARAAEPAAPAPAGPPRGGSVEVRDLLGSDGAADAGTPPIKPGSVEVRDLLAEQGAPPVAPEPTQPARPSAAKPASAARPSAAPPPGTTMPPQAAPPMPRAESDVPSLDELVASGQLSPPDLSLDMHAYSPEAAARFVYINMRRYHIGDTTREGAVVEDITPDGVVLELQGRRFALSSR